MTDFSFKGIDIDAAYSSICESLFSDYDLTIYNEDLFKFAESGDLREKCHILVTNPPYVRHHHILPALKEILQSRVIRDLGIHVSGLSGLYVYYMLICDRFLAADGVATWLIPCEFLYTNYGKALREYLRNKVTLLRIHKFQSKDVQFDDALVSSCVVTYKKHTPDDKATMRVTTGDFKAPTSSRDILLSQIVPEEKWTFIYDSENSNEGGILLGDIFQVTRGLATGKNGFFIMSRDAARQKGMDDTFLIPLLPGPRYLDAQIIESTSDGIPIVERTRYLLSIELPEDELKTEYPKVYAYLQEGVAQGVSDGYLCKSRKFWYLQEKRKPPLFVASYMGRGDANGSSPIRFFLNRSSALATNAFICLYPKPALQKLLDGHPEREEELLSLLTSIPQAVIERAGRSYGGGLKKVEPKELRSLPLNNIPGWLAIKRTEQVDLFASHRIFGVDTVKVEVG